MFVQISANLFVWFDKLDDGSYVAIVLGIAGVYIAGNTYQKREQIKSGNTDTDSELKEELK
jgi:hypothetical protein